MLKWLVVLITILAGGYSIYWFVGASATERGTESAVDQLRADGWQIDYDALTVRGFPSRFDTTVEPVDVTAPSGLRWTAPFVQVFALSYRPNAVIIVWPQEQRLTLGGAELTLTSEDLRASAAVALSSNPALERATAEGKAVSLSGAFGAIDAVSALLALRETEDRAQTYDIYAGFDGLDLPGLPSLAVTFDATAQFDQALDASLTGSPGVLSLEVKELRLDQDEAWLSAQGEIAPGADGFPQGRLSLQTREPLVLLNLLQEADILNEEAASLVRGILAPAEPDDDGVIRFAIGFDGGFATLGAVPLFEVPRWPF